MSLPTEPLSAELVRALRARSDRAQVDGAPAGRRMAQRALSKRLGFHTNVIYSWEAGRRAPSASDLFRLASEVGVNVVAALQAFQGAPVAGLADCRPTEPDGVRHLLDLWAANMKVSDLARALSVNRNTVARWLDGTTEPRFPEFLAFIDATTGRLLDFIQHFASADQLPTARAAMDDLQAQRRAAYELPYSHAVLRALELTDYRKQPRHDARWLARRLGLTVPEVDAAVGALSQANVIRLRGKHFEAQRVLTVDTRANAAGNWALKYHWASVGAARAKRRPGPEAGRFSYNLFAISRAGFRRLSQMQLDHFDAVRRVVAADTNPECVALMNLQLFTLGKD